MIFFRNIRLKRVYTVRFLEIGSGGWVMRRLLLASESEYDICLRRKWLRGENKLRRVISRCNRRRNVREK
jgi:hypothetical protein